MPKKIIFIAFLTFLLTAADVHADVIYLKNGSKVSGIITKEDEDSIEIKINIGATVSFSKQDIVRIEKESGEAHTKMEGAWESERAKREVEGMTEGIFVEEQKEKGLVEYEGKWVTPEEKERLQAASIAGGLGKGREEKRFLFKRDRARRSDFARKLLEKGNWFIKETEHFTIFYRDIAQAKIVSDKAEYYFEKITYDLGYEKELKWNEKCQVYIIETVDRWKAFLKDIGFNVELVGGFVPNYDKREMFICVLSDAYLAVTFPHELTHLIFRDLAQKSAIPLWLNEGLANYEASLTGISNELLVKEIKRGRHILLGDLLRMSSYPEGREMRELFYAQSEKMVEFLITQYGRKKFRLFCGLILKDRSFIESLFAVYKEDFKDIEDFNVKLVEYIVK